MYWNETALYFTLAVNNTSTKYDEFSVVHYILASKDNYFQDLMLPLTVRRIKVLQRDCIDMEKWLKVRTAGLLEVDISRTKSIYGRKLAGGDLSEDETIDVKTRAGEITKHRENNLSSKNATKRDLETFHELLQIRKATKLRSKREAILNGPSDAKAIKHSLFHRKVTFVHRSVAQFLEGEKCNEILKSCSQCTALTKILQSYILLSTLRDKFGFPMKDVCPCSHLYQMIEYAR